MPAAKISALTSYTAPLSADLLAIVENASTITKKITYANLTAPLLKIDGSNVMTNNVALQQKDSSAVARNILKVTSGDVLEIGNTTTTLKLKAGSSTTSGHTVPNIADDTVALLAAAQTLSNKTIASPTLSGTVIGTYTLAGTPTITAPTISSPVVTSPPSNISRLAGEITMWSTTSAPTDWLLCDGTSYLRADYAALFAVIGTTFGSVDGTHFNVPNLKGKVPVGYDSSQTEFDAMAETGGAKTHTLTSAEMPAHTHNVEGSAAGGAGGTRIDAGTSGVTDVTSSTGSGGAHNNLQPYITLTFIIKT